MRCTACVGSGHMPSGARCWLCQGNRLEPIYPNEKRVTVTFDSGASETIPQGRPGILESALAACKARDLGGTIMRDGQIIGYVRRTASAGGWNAYFTERFYDEA